MLTTRLWRSGLATHMIKGGTDVAVTPHDLAAAMLMLLMVCDSDAQIPRARLPWRLDFVRWRLNFCVLGMELSSYHPSGA